MQRYALISQSSGPGVFAHELGHLLFEWPDLYGQTQPTAWDGNGLWCLMGLGATVQNEMWVPHPSAFLKHWNGWSTNLVRAEPTDEYITLHNVAETGEVLKIQPEHLPKDRFFLLEARVAGYNPTLLNMDYYLPGSRLLVWQIDQSGYPDDLERPWCRMIEADGLINLMTVEQPPAHSNVGDDGDPFPGSANTTTLYDSSVPAKVSFPDGTPAGFSLTEIAYNADTRSASFRLRIP